MKLLLTLMFLATHVYSGRAVIRGAIAEKGKLSTEQVKHILREPSPYSGHAAVRGADDAVRGADAAKNRILEDTMVANHCGFFNATCVTCAVCAPGPDDTANRLTCL